MVPGRGFLVSRPIPVGVCCGVVTPVVEQALARAADIIQRSRRLIAFTGAGISVESGVPAFRGEGGIWEKTDPSALEIARFRQDPGACWAVIREIFYTRAANGTSPEPNAAHRVLAQWEREGILSFLVTQNIDGLHSAAGSVQLAEFHGSLRELVCQRCGGRVGATRQALDEGLLAELPPRCRVQSSGGGPCGGVLKPDFVFFGEAIPSGPHAARFPQLGKRTPAS